MFSLTAVITDSVLIYDDVITESAVSKEALSCFLFLPDISKINKNGSNAKPAANIGIRNILFIALAIKTPTIARTNEVKHIFEKLFILFSVFSVFLASLIIFLIPRNFFGFTLCFTLFCSFTFCFFFIDIN